MECDTHFFVDKIYARRVRACVLRWLLPFMTVSVPKPLVKLSESEYEVEGRPTVLSFIRCRHTFRVLALE